MKYLKTYNESIKSLMTPKEVDFSKLSTDKILTKSVEFDLLDGFKYLIDNDLVDETTKYIIEKYKLGLHQGELKDYEEWFLNQLIDLNVFKSKNNKNVLIYKKGDDTLFNYNEENKVFYYDYYKIYSVFESKFELNKLLINSIVKGMVEEHLKIKVDTTYVA